MSPFAVTTMMYGFGDDQTPYKESVELVEVTICTLLQPYALAVLISAFSMCLRSLNLHSCARLHLAPKGLVNAAAGAPPCMCFMP